MIERVTIYGDSFADPKYEPKSLHPTWYGLLKKEGYDVTNLGKSGSGPMFSFKHMYQNAHSYNEKDIIVFILSGVNRLCITGNHKEDAEMYDSIEEDVDLFEILKDELTYGNWKYESFLYALSRKQCRVFTYFLTYEESFFKSSLNDGRYYCHHEDLENACWNEYIEEERSRDASDDQHFRSNHLSAENHVIMYQQITNFINSKPIPDFLQGIYKGTYNKDEFVYD